MTNKLLQMRTMMPCKQFPDDLNIIKSVGEKTTLCVMFMQCLYHKELSQTLTFVCTSFWGYEITTS